MGVGISEKTVYYEISRENMEKALRSDKDAYEVMIYAETVPFTEIERYKLLISKCPNKEFREILEIRYNKFVGKKQ